MAKRLNGYTVMELCCYGTIANCYIATNPIFKSPNQQIDKSIRAPTITDPLKEIHSDGYHMGTHAVTEDFV